MSSVFLSPSDPHDGRKSYVRYVRPKHEDLLTTLLKPIAEANANRCRWLPSAEPKTQPAEPANRTSSEWASGRRGRSALFFTSEIIAIAALIRRQEISGARPKQNSGHARYCSYVVLPNR